MVSPWSGQFGCSQGECILPVKVLPVTYVHQDAEYWMHHVRKDAMSAGSGKTGKSWKPVPEQWSAQVRLGVTRRGNFVQGGVRGGGGGRGTQWARGCGLSGQVTVICVGRSPSTGWECPRQSSRGDTWWGERLSRRRLYRDISDGLLLSLSSSSPLPLHTPPPHLPRFSRASYVLSLLRPTILQELELAKHGLKVHLRDPSSYTPIRSHCTIHFARPSLHQEKNLFVLRRLSY